MPARNALTRLAAVAPSAEPVLDPGEEDGILARVLAAPRQRSRRRPLALALVAVAVIGAAAIAASLGLRHPHPSAANGPEHVALTGVRIEMAGYRFRTPAGFTASTSACMSAPTAGEPRPALDGFAAAADGACVEGAYVVAEDWLQTHDPIPDSAQAVDVDSYRGYYVAGIESTLYVRLPHADADRVVYLALRARGVTEDELIAIAASGLPTLPTMDPTTTTGTETTG